jgi:serine/threonine protein kinase
MTAERYRTIQLRSEVAGDLEAKNNDFSAVRVGGAIDGYRVVENLAEGGMGAVFRVRERESNREVALKTPLPGGRGGTYHHRLQRFLREARLTSRMNHEGVAAVRDQGQCDGLPYFTIDLVDGVPLSDRLYEEGVLPIRESLEIVEKTARAAHHVHQKGVIHRDLKPANILIKPDGSPVIIDFGLARDALGIDPRITDSGIWLGTPAYISPEQALGEASRVDSRADVYSLGAILYELLTGLPPFGVGRPRTIFRALRDSNVRAPSELRTELPECVDELVLNALARDPKDRFANAEHFANAIADVLEELEGEELEASGLECSWQSDESENEVACGWNEEIPGLVNSAPESEFTFPDCDDLELVTPRKDSTRAPALERSSKSNKALKRTSKSNKALRRSSKAKAAKRSSKSSKARRRSSAANRTSPRRRGRLRRQRDDSFEAMTRYVAFFGPVVVALLGFFLLLGQ